jgi:hypothetical protein
MSSDDRCHFCLFHARFPQAHEFLYSREILLLSRISLDCKENLANVCPSESLADELRKNFGE